MMNLEILASQVSDNFFYLVHVPRDSQPDFVALVDPIDHALALARLDELGLTPTHLINTHWHPDHIGGNASILEAFPSLMLVGPAEERGMISEMQRDDLAIQAVSGGDSVEGLLEVLDTPGHTMGHVTFRVEDHLLSGDTIFSAGAGNVRFGGDPGTLFSTFRDVLRELPGQLICCPGHDYAGRNLDFALSLEPEHAGLLAQRERVAAQPERTILLTTLEEERGFNPFLRFDDSGLYKAIQARHPDVLATERERSGDDHEAVFRTLRTLRDQW